MIFFQKSLGNWKKKKNMLASVLHQGKKATYVFFCVNHLFQAIWSRIFFHKFFFKFLFRIIWNVKKKLTKKFPLPPGYPWNVKKNPFTPRIPPGFLPCFLHTTHPSTCSEPRSTFHIPCIPLPSPQSWKEQKLQPS